MYLHLGQAVVVNQRDIVAIFDMDNATWSHRTRAFVVCRKGKGEQVVYLSQLSSATLKGRAEEGWLE